LDDRKGIRPFKTCITYRQGALLEQVARERKRENLFAEETTTQSSSVTITTNLQWQAARGGVCPSKLAAYDIQQNRLITTYIDRKQYKKQDNKNNNKTVQVQMQENKESSCHVSANVQTS